MRMPLAVRTISLSLLAATALASPLAAQPKTIAERLGHPANAKLVIIHADDLGVAHSVDSASFAALDARTVSSASIMMPTPWVTEVAAYAKAHPDADLGLHLTLTSEWKTYRWGSVAPASEVRSLFAPDGTLPDETAAVAAKASPAEVERELRAQVERALALGIRPTHLDSHMGALFTTPALFAAYAKVAHDYGLPFLAPRPTSDAERKIVSVGDRDVVVDAVVSPGPEVPAEQWTQWYVDAIRNLKPGLTYMIVHLGRDDAELQAVTVDHVPWGSAWRGRDAAAVASPAFAAALREAGVVVVRWRDLQRLVR